MNVLFDIIAPVIGQFAYLGFRDCQGRRKRARRQLVELLPPLIGDGTADLPIVGASKASD